MTDRERALQHLRSLIAVTRDAGQQLLAERVTPEEAVETVALLAVAIAADIGLPFTGLADSWAQGVAWRATVAGRECQRALAARRKEKESR